MSEKICFIISPIGSKDEGTWSRWDKVRRHLIEEVAAKKGYKVIRADDISKPGIITSQIIEHLLSSELVIADLSTKNANVFYELAIRDAARLPVILIGDTTDIPFDIRQQRMIKYSLDPDDLDEACTKLGKYIDSVIDESFKVDSPVTEAILKPSDEISATSEEYLELILEKLNILGADLRQEIISLQSVSYPAVQRNKPTLILDPIKGPPGTKINISGQSKYPEEYISIIFDAPGEYVWDFQTNPRGFFEIAWTIPNLIEGSYTFRLLGRYYGLTARFKVT